MVLFVCKATRVLISRHSPAMVRITVWRFASALTSGKAALCNFPCRSVLCWREGFFRCRFYSRWWDSSCQSIDKPAFSYGADYCLKISECFDVWGGCTTGAISRATLFSVEEKDSFRCRFFQDDEIRGLAWGGAIKLFHTVFELRNHKADARGRHTYVQKTEEQEAMLRRGRLHRPHRRRGHRRCNIRRDLEEIRARRLQQKPHPKRATELRTSSQSSRVRWPWLGELTTDPCCWSRWAGRISSAIPILCDRPRFTVNIWSLFVFAQFWSGSLWNYLQQDNVSELPVCGALKSFLQDICHSGCFIFAMQVAVF